MKEGNIQIRSIVRASELINYFQTNLVGILIDLDTRITYYSVEIQSHRFTTSSFTDQISEFRSEFHFSVRIFLLKTLLLGFKEPTGIN